MFNKLGKVVPRGKAKKNSHPHARLKAQIELAVKLTGKPESAIRAALNRKIPLVDYIIQGWVDKLNQDFVIKLTPAKVINDTTSEPGDDFDQPEVYPQDDPNDTRPQDIPEDDSDADF